jgi:hypothetical protein
VHENERRLLHALAVMARQYLEREDLVLETGLVQVSLDNLAMSAGEEAMELLAEYGLITMEEGQARFGEWTAAGSELLHSN